MRRCWRDSGLFRAGLACLLAIGWLASVHAAVAPAGLAPSLGYDDLMQGAPPPLAHRVDRGNWLLPPYNVWALKNMERIVPTATVDRGDGLPTLLAPLPLDLGRFTFVGPDARLRGFEAFLEEQHVDALLVWHAGSLRVERYRAGQTARTRHLLMSVSKSFTGLLAEMLVAAKQVDDMRLASFYVPELRGSAYEDASVREVMDMEAAVDFREVYDDPWSDISRLIYAAGLLNPPDGIRVAPSLYEFLPTLRKQGEHGMDFHYATANAEVLAWVMSRATGKPVAQLFEELLYSHIGAERDAFYITDPVGTAMAGLGLNVTARDLLRLGVMMAQRGQYNARQIVNPEIIERIEAGGMRRQSLLDNAQAPFNSYKSKWYIHHPTGSYSASGIHGQHLFIAPEQQIVLVMQSSHPLATGPFIATNEAFLHALVEHLQQGH